ncbi:MAG: hypothetical protein ACLP1X_18645 [Polyangiaceae bacterium]
MSAETWRVELKGKLGRAFFEDWTPEDGTTYDTLELAIKEAQSCPPDCSVSVVNLADGTRILVQGLRGRDVSGRFARSRK